MWCRLCRLRHAELSCSKTALYGVLIIWWHVRLVITDLIRVHLFYFLVCLLFFLCGQRLRFSFLWHWAAGPVVWSGEEGAIELCYVVGASLLARERGPLVPEARSILLKRIALRDGTRCNLWDEERIIVWLLVLWLPYRRQWPLALRSLQIGLFCYETCGLLADFVLSSWRILRFFGLVFGIEGPHLCVDELLRWILLLFVFGRWRELACINAARVGRLLLLVTVVGPCYSSEEPCLAVLAHG